MLIRKSIKLLSFTFVILLITLVTSSATAFVLEPSMTPYTETEWVLYTDSRFDFTMEYPANWEIYPRSDEPGTVGGTLILSEPVTTGESLSEMSQPAKIEVGLYLVEREPSYSIADWSEQYDASHDVFETNRILVLDTEEIPQITKHNREGFQKSAISPLTPYTYVNIPHDRVVWFLWMNRIDEEHKAILKRVANSMQFGKGAPTTLQDAYGAKFQPRLLNPTSLISDEQNTLGRINPILFGTPWAYAPPMNGSRSINCGHKNAPICNGTHTNGALYALDIYATDGTWVYNAATAITIDFSWSNSGYGNLVRMKDTVGTSYLSYYAHLSTIYYWVLDDHYTTPLTRGSHIANSGQTGAGGPHLHFHVQTTGGNAVDLHNMDGVSLNANYPNCQKQSSQCPGGFDCTCGWLN